MDKDIQDYCWTIKLNNEFKDKLLPFKRPRLKQAVQFLCLPLRLNFLKVLLILIGSKVVH